MDITDFQKAVEEAKAQSKKRNFVQTIDLIFNFQNLDFNKPENRLSLDIVLPKGRGKLAKVCVIAGDELLAEAKHNAQFVIAKDEIPKLAAEPVKLKKLAEEYDFWFCQVDLMAGVGKAFGQVLAPRGKMPKPLPPNVKLDIMVKRLQDTVFVRNRGKFLPTVHTIVGTEEMPTQDLAENAMAVYDVVKAKLPTKEGNFRSIFIKESMGSAIKVVAHKK